MNYIYQNRHNFFIIGVILLFGSFIAINRGSNFSDSDSYSVLLSFLDLIDKGVYNPSRGAYGHPIPELLIGYFAYVFGTPYSNLFCFYCFFLSNIFLYKTFINKNNYLFIFLLLVCSNFYLFFDNTNSIDYPIALLFFSLGLFFLRKNYLYLSSILFALCIASRANFSIFIYPIILIYFFDDVINGKYKKFIYSIFLITLIGIIFYFPVFKTNNYTLSFLDIPFLTSGHEKDGWYGGPALELKSILPRFIYKTYKLIGIFSFLIFLIFFKSFIKYLLSFNKDNLMLSSTILINLIIYFLMPTKFLLINPFIIFLYIISFKILKKKILYILIILNLFQWIINYEIIEIKHKYSDICKPVVALDAKLKFSIQQGKAIDYIFNKKNYKDCYSKFLGKYSQNFKDGSPLKKRN